MTNFKITELEGPKTYLTFLYFIILLLWYNLKLNFLLLVWCYKVDDKKLKC